MNQTMTCFNCAHPAKEICEDCPGEDNRLFWCPLCGTLSETINGLKQIPQIPQRDGDFTVGSQNWMTLRDWFAGMALQGFLAAETDDNCRPHEQNARWAYAQADAMLAQRQKESKE